MSKIVIGFVMLAAALAAGVEPSSAQTRRWCTEGGMGSGVATCAYDTQAQCLASASGNGQSCIENPQYQPPAAPKVKKKRKS
jgi:Protein of unknown function (DUF3551)